MMIMKKIRWLILFLLLIGVFYYKNEIYELYHNLTKKELSEDIINNAYAKDDSYEFVQLTDNFYPENQQDILNIYYTIINSGVETATFYCPSSYENCISDVIDIASQKETISAINHMVHPFNQFQNELITNYNSLGEITIQLEHAYSDNDIKLIEDKMEQIIQDIWNDNMSIEEKIKQAHDYIINYNTYDTARRDNHISNYQSDTAYGTLLQGYGICSGYTDAMALFLEKLKIKNYKITSDTHIWNGLYLNNEWLHLDLTWDDPILDGANLLSHDYFLITTATLQSFHTQQHQYNPTIYSEMQKQGG